MRARSRAASLNVKVRKAGDWRLKTSLALGDGMALHSPKPSQKQNPALRLSASGGNWLYLPLRRWIVHGKQGRKGGRKRIRDPPATPHSRCESWKEKSTSFQIWTAVLVPPGD